jgi:hypothetical protein
MKRLAAWIVGRLRAVRDTVVLAIDRPHSRSLILATVVVLVGVAAGAEGKTLTTPEGLLRDPAARALGLSLVLLAGLYTAVQRRGFTLEVIAAENTERDRYCRAFAESRSLDVAARSYRDGLRRGDHATIDAARSRIPSLIRR